jgi:hypothetical protein
LIRQKTEASKPSIAWPAAGMSVFWQVIALAGAAPPASSPAAEQSARRAGVTVFLTMRSKLARPGPARPPPKTAESDREIPLAETG